MTFQPRSVEVILLGAWFDTIDCLVMFAEGDAMGPALAAIRVIAQEPERCSARLAFVLMVRHSSDAAVAAVRDDLQRIARGCLQSEDPIDYDALGITAAVSFARMALAGRHVCKGG